MDDRVLRTNRRALLEVVSPLHIGSGSGPLLLDYDFAFERGVAWVMDPARVLERFDDEELRHGIPEIRLSKILKPRDYSQCAAYSLAVPGQVAGEILPFLKDVEGRPYVPGSSLKGALRSVVGWAAGREERWAPRSQELVGRRAAAKWAAAGWERRVFGPNPNHDLLRCLLVDDSAAVPREQLDLALVSIYSLRGTRLEPKGTGYRFSAEVLRSGTRLECRIGVDEYALRHPRLGMADRRAWIDGLAGLCRERTAELLAAEKAFYSRCGLRPLQQFYEGLERRASDLAENQFLVQMSWGTGWSAKTLGRTLSESESFGQLRQVYRLGRPGAPFPKSRRLVERGGVASEPMGWVRVTL